MQKSVIFQLQLPDHIILLDCGWRSVVAEAVNFWKMQLAWHWWWLWWCSGQTDWWRSRRTQNLNMTTTKLKRLQRHPVLCLCAALGWYPMTIQYKYFWASIYYNKENIPAKIQLDQPFGHGWQASGKRPTSGPRSIPKDNFRDSLHLFMKFGSEKLFWSYPGILEPCFRILGP